MNRMRIAGFGLLVLLPGCTSVADLGLPGTSSWGYGAPEPLARVALPTPAPLRVPAAPMAARSFPLAPAIPPERPTGAPYDHRTDPVITAIIQPMTVPIPAGAPDGTGPQLPPAPVPRIVDIAPVHAALAAAAD